MNHKTLRITILGLMAALAYIAFTFLQIKIPTAGGTTSFHLGNTFCILAALLIGGVPGGIAGAIGMAIGDLLDPIYVTYVPKTIFLKFGIGVIAGYLAHKVFRINERKEKKSILIATIVSCSGGMAFNVLLEPIVSYLYNRFVFGINADASTILASWNAITTGTNALLSITCATIIYMAIRPQLQRSNIIQKLVPTKE